MAGVILPQLQRFRYRDFATEGYMKYYRLISKPPENACYIAADIEGRVVIHLWVDDLTGGVELVYTLGQRVTITEGKIDLVKMSDINTPMFMGSLEEISQEMFLSLFNL
jgi:hypothetical protein